MHPSAHARSTPEKPAIVMAESGETIGYGALEALSNQSAHLLRRLGLRRGDTVATLFGNAPEVFVFGWAAQRAGLYLTSISNRLSAADIAYILGDCGAKRLVASDAYLSLAGDAAAAAGGLPPHGWTDWAALAAQEPATPIADESAGTDMLYSSGTTGRPKGVKFPLPEGPIDDPTPLAAMGRDLYAMGPDTRYLSTSPLYHAAPLRWAMTVQRLGGTVVVMERFDAERALALIERHRITHGTFVPTHFIRMLKLPEAVRGRYDLSSLRAVVHAAAPCPVPVKRAMIDWWGPIVHEYYSGTESCGITALSAEEWLSRPGSVGRAVLGSLRITDDEGRLLPAGQEGNICFADGPRFAYHNDPEKTARAYDANGWATLGDIGRVDEDGYLFLTDRKNFMIISGGVNIYPQEIENLLVTHPKVADAAVIGVPDEEMGEQVLAVVQPAAGVAGDEALADELCRFARAALGGVKTPRRYEFRDELPREATGKLMKRRLIDAYR
ncbi:acyl-CoA synthetase [Flavisphingomonas formosensis]|uniref:acyl-CoA synthetase n=1 Tax=Flavisphingomonas formosensis TaxID=861534 RepID=UPI0012FAE21F|nr:acyl-CoA synthetase [Sphingomonas formosensis]